MIRRAQCSCGAVEAVLNGEPASVVACHCRACQRRTGSVVGVGAYYPAEQVELSGTTRTYTRSSDAGNAFTSHFCPTCGTSLWWESAKNPGLIGIAVGAIADPTFPTPARSVWEETKHDWLSIDAIAAHFPKGRGG